MKQKKYSHFLRLFPISSILFILCVFFAKPLSSLEYGILAKNENIVPITKLFVISERCCGSNFINSLILQNFQVEDVRLGQKHFPPWYDLSIDFYRGNSQYYDFHDTSDFLFVIIFRDPYDWIRSIHLQPFHAHHSLYHLPFSKFIRKPWELNPKNDTAQEQRELNPLADLNPQTGKRFRNVLHLRTEKIKNMLQIFDRASNVYYIKYEVVRDHPQEVLRELASLFTMTPNSSYKPVTTYKGKGEKKYKEKKYQSISEEDLKYINAHLNWKVERRIGYRQITNPAEID